MFRAVIFLVTLGARALQAMCRRRADLVIGKPRSAATSDGAEERAPAPTARRRRSSLLGGASRIVASVGQSSGHRQSRHGGRVESGAISTMLDAHLEHALPGTASPRCGDSPAHPADGARRLGSTADPRRAHEARFHRVRGDGIALHPAPACRGRPSEALGRVLAQPQGRHRSDGLFTVPTASLRPMPGKEVL